MDEIKTLFNYYVCDYARKKGWTDATIKNKKFRLGRFITWLKVKTFTKVNNEQIDCYGELLRKRGLADRTRNSELAVIKAFLKYAKEKDYSVAADLTEIVRCKVEDPNRKAYTERQIKKMLDKTEGETEFLIISLAYYVGLRRFEIAQLRKQDVHGEMLYFMGKGHRRRKAYIPSWLAQRLAKYIAINDSEWVFRSSHQAVKGARRNHIHPSTVGQISKRVAARANIKNFHIHELRYSLATTMDKRNIKLSHIQMALGHRDVRTTQLYIQRDFNDYITSYNACFSTES